MKLLRAPVGLLLALAATLGFGAAGLPLGPDFFLVPVADAARGGTPLLAMFVGLAGGLLEDALGNPERLLGLHAFGKVLLGYLLATLGARMIVEKPAAVGGLLAAAVLVETALVVVLLWILRGTPSVPRLDGVLIRAGATGLLGGMLFALSRVPWRERWSARRRRRLS